MCFFHEQAVKHETPTIAPLPRDDVLDRTTCVNVIKMSIGPLIWRLLSNMHRHAGMLSSSGLHGSRDVLLADKLGGGGSEQRGNGHRVDAGTTKRTAMNKKQRAWDEPPRMFIFSGHDSTITPLLLALGLPETKWPKFASRQVLIVRMRSDSKSIACMHRMFLIRTYISCHGTCALLYYVYSHPLTLSLTYELWQSPVRASESHLHDPPADESSDEEMRRRLLSSNNERFSPRNHYIAQQGGTFSYFVRVIYDKKVLNLPNSLPGENATARSYISCISNLVICCATLHSALSSPHAMLNKHSTASSEFILCHTGGWITLADFASELMEPFSASDAQKASICRMEVSAVM